MKGIKVITTYNCNIMCSHCEYKCGPHKKGLMSVKEFKEKVYIEHNKGYGDYLIIQGGEIFLHTGTVYKYLKSVMDLNMKKILVTNGFWGYEDTYLDILQDFKKYGVDSIVIEYDYFHSLFIDENCINKAINKVKLCNFKVYLKSTFVTDDIYTTEDLRSFEIIKSIKGIYNNIDCIMEVSGYKKKLRDEIVIEYQR